MIEHMKPTDSIFESGAEALVCPVDALGGMSAGLSFQFAQRYDGMAKEHERLCHWLKAHRAEWRAGCLFIWHNEYDRWFTEWVFNLPTRWHWKQPSQPMLIEAGMATVASEVKRNEIKSIAIPALGCGLGGLDWKDVRPLIEEAFKELPEVRVMLYPPKEEESK
jgi:O-acetyl-ADP-ribose deacetylase (regulator of RNase III)